jgi:hypothetical protein
MLSLKDCLDMSEVSDAELAAIARHERIPPIVALELGQKLIQSAEGVAILRQFILDDIADAQRHGRCRDCDQFSRALADHLESHPDARRAASTPDESLRELLAIGRVQEVRRVLEDSGEPQGDALGAVQEARDRSDCRACRRLSLAVLHLLDSPEAGASA